MPQQQFKIIKIIHKKKILYIIKSIIIFLKKNILI